MIADRYRALKAELPPHVTLVAVTKGRPIEDVQALVALGHEDFGENRTDALVARRLELPKARWHFIGNIQRNKLPALTGAHLVHSFDRPDLASRWDRSIPVLIQVNVARVGNRNGVEPDEVEETLVACDAAGIDARGLAMIAPLGEDARRHFGALRATRDRLRPSWPALRELSMGMSADWRAAVEEGATVVRIGRALFEPDPRPA